MNRLQVHSKEMPIFYKETTQKLMPTRKSRHNRKVGIRRIEVFYRAAKQELGLSNCHSTTEIHHHAHLELLFAAETLLNYAQWYENKEKTSDGECFTHGEMVSSLFHTRCEIQLKARKGIQQVYIQT